MSDISASLLEMIKEEEVVANLLTAKAMAESEISSHVRNKENINQLISSFNDLNLIEKFTKGKDAQKKPGVKIYHHTIV